jgi:hypothetical protein
VNAVRVKLTKILPFLETGHENCAFKKNFLLYSSKHAKTDHSSKICCGSPYQELREARSTDLPEPMSADIN